MNLYTQHKDSEEIQLGTCTQDSEEGEGLC